MDFVVKNSGEINVIFLHGWGADFSSFYFLKDVISDCKLHFANLDGFGGSEEPDDPTISGYANRLYAYISNQQLKNVVLVGHSFGGRVAIEYASAHRVLGLVLVNSAGLKPRFSFKKYCRKIKFKIIKWLVNSKVISSSKLDSYGSIDYKQASPQMRRVLVSCVNHNQKPLLKQINTDCLIFWGKDDTDTPLYMAKTLHKHIKKSKMVVVSKCGHFSFLDNQYAFYCALRDFLDKQKGELYE